MKIKDPLQTNFLFILIGLSLLSAAPSPNSFAKSVKQKKKETKLEDISTPGDLEVCFSPEEPCDLKLIKMIQGAKKSIDMAIYDINRDQLVHELIVASKKIPVRILVDKRQAKGNHSLVPLLLKAKLNVRYGRQRGIMHNKFTLVDDTILETGSFNYTNHASTSNNENQIYLTQPLVISKYKDRFSILWKNGRLPSHSNFKESK